MFQNKEERKRQKQLKHLSEIAEAFLKARSVYPADYDGFLLIAGEKDVEVFYQTMHLVTEGALKIHYSFDWWYDEQQQEWTYVFKDLL